MISIPTIAAWVTWFSIALKGSYVLNLNIIFGYTNTMYILHITIV